jgi:hypothetical protein
MRVSIPLSYFQGPLLIRFRAINGYGNNIFIDNINLDLLTGTRDEQVCDAISVYPNPFSTSVAFEYILPESTQVILRIFDSFGRLVTEPVNEFRQKGEQKLQWNAETLPAGMYYCILNSGKQVITEKIIKY